MTTDPKRPIRQSPLDKVMPLLRNWVSNRTFRERAQAEEDDCKKRLMDILADFGQDTGGHRQLELPEPVPYGTKKITAIRRTRRVGMNLNTERTEALLDKLGLRDACSVTVTTISEELILAANYRGDISDADLKSLYDEKVTYAFDPIKENNDE